jgi:hypothetical protein
VRWKLGNNSPRRCTERAPPRLKSTPSKCEASCRPASDPPLPERRRGARREANHAPPARAGHVGSARSSRDTRPVKFSRSRGACGGSNTANRRGARMPAAHAASVRALTPAEMPKVIGTKCARRGRSDPGAREAVQAGERVFQTPARAAEACSVPRAPPQRWRGFGVQ